MDYRLIRWESLTKLFCPCLFKSLDGHPITFYFHIDNSEVKKKFEYLVIKCGGSIVEEYVNMTPFTALMVDDKCVKNIYNRVSFKASYIIDCIKSGCLKHINTYIHSNIPRFMNNDYMKVLFLRICTFTEENVYRGEREDSPCSNDVVKPATVHQITVNKTRPNVINDLPKERYTINSNACGSKQATNIIISNDHTLPSKKQAERKCSNPCFHCTEYLGNVGTSRDTGVIEKQDTVQEKHCPTCKCASIKSSDTEQPQKQDRIRKSLKSRSSSRRIIDSSSSSSEEIASKRRSPSGSSVNSDRSRSKHNQLISNEDDVIEATIPTNIEIASKKNEHGTSHCVLSEDDDDDVGPPAHFLQKRSEKHTRKLYSRKEQEAILKYLIRKDALHAVNGVLIWKKMERDEICPNRTWNSLSNHFRKTLVNELEKFPFLTPTQIKLFRK